MLITKLLKDGYRYQKLRKTVSKFYRSRSKSMTKYNVNLKTLLHEGLSEFEMYNDLVYEFRKMISKTNLSEQFKHCHSLQKDRLQNGYSATNCMHSC